MVFLKNRNTEKRETKIINKILFLLCFLLLISISILIGVYLGVLTTVKSVVIAFIALVFILSLFFIAFSVNCAILDSILSLNKRHILFQINLYIFYLVIHQIQFF